MHIEVQVALNFVISYLYNKLPRRRVNIFGEELEKALKDKFQGHWYPEKPFKVCFKWKRNDFFFFSYFHLFLYFPLRDRPCNIEYIKSKSNCHLTFCVGIPFIFTFFSFFFFFIHNYRISFIIASWENISTSWTARATK